MLYLSERSTVYILLYNPLPCLGIFSHFRVGPRTSEFARERSRARLIGMSGDRSGLLGCSTNCWQVVMHSYNLALKLFAMRDVEAALEGEYAFLVVPIGEAVPDHCFVGVFR
jgi:hypothetical protein